MTNYKALQIKVTYPDILTILKDSLSSTFSTFRGVSDNLISNSSQSRGEFIKRGARNFFNNKKLVRGLAIVLLVVAGVFAVSKVVGNIRGSNSSEKIEVKGATATQDINKEFSFPLRLDSGDEVGKVKYMVERGELRDEIVVKGQKATAISGRVFLIFTLKISNEYSKAIEMNTKDYVRLSVNGNKDEWLAPDIHNDPVEVQAISTKYTRVGFPLNTTDKDIILRVGEIDGEKEEIPLVFN